MRVFLIAAAGVLSLSGVSAAAAADLGQQMVTKATPMQSAPISPVYNWTGFYIGGNVGCGWSHRDFTNTITGRWEAFSAAELLAAATTDMESLEGVKSASTISS